MNDRTITITVIEFFPNELLSNICQAFFFLLKSIKFQGHPKQKTQFH